MRSWILKFVSYLLLFALACAAVVLATGCGGTAGLFGIASTSDLNDESKQLQAFARSEAEARQVATHAAIVESVRPLDAVFPNLSASVAATLAGAPYRPTPEIPARDEDGAFPWWAEEATAIGVSTVLAYLGVNTVRDRKRRKRGEPVTAEEVEARERERRMYADIAKSEKVA